jgi:hypothetical protein
VREGLAAAVAGRRRLHQAGIQFVLHVGAQHAVLDQHVALRRRAFIVDRQRTAPFDGAVVDDRHASAATCSPRRPLKADVPAREVAQSVADGLVQQRRPGPSTTVIVPAGGGRPG